MNGDDAAGYAPSKEKRLTTAIARAALVGVTVHRIEGDFVREVFIATKWALTREFTDLDSLEAWLDIVTGQSVRQAGVPA
jgi:hypothetical protein